MVHRLFVRARVAASALFVLAVWTSASSSLYGQAASYEFAVEKLIAPADSSPGVAYRWIAAFPGGDMDGDGWGDVYLHGSVEDSSAVSTMYLLSAGELMGSEALAVRSPLLPWCHLHYVAGLRAGAAWRMTNQMHNSYYDLGLYDLGTQSVIEVFRAGLLAPGVSADPSRVLSAGDQDGDGYDDFFLRYFIHDTNGADYLGVRLIDGRTLTEVWRTVYSQNGEAWECLASQYAAPPDLDGDGRADYVSTTFEIAQPWPTFQVSVQVHSGADGSVAWSRVLPGGTSGPNRIVDDLTGDGVPDVVVKTVDIAIPNGSFLTLLDGADGTTVWTTAFQHLDAWLPSWAYSWKTGGAQQVLYSQVDPWTGQLEVVVLFWVQDVNSYEEFYMVHIDAQSGAVTGVDQVAPDGGPWSPVSLGATYTPVGYNQLGDVDRDGLQEFAHSLVEPIWPWATFPWGGTLPSAALAVFGQRTLRCPDSAPVGSTVTLDFAIPSAGGRECVVLAATAVDRYDGFTIAGWDTGLVATDPILAALAPNYPLRLTLDSAGRGSLQVPIPAQSWLVGETLYVRGVVKGSSAADPVWTMSSIGEILLLP